MIRKIETNEKAKEKLLRGVEKLSNAVKITLGPKGRNVVIDKMYIEPIITNDGVTIAKQIELEDEIEDAGASILRGACTKTNDIAGDGTTTATILAEKIFSEGLKCFNTGANPILLRNGIKKATDFVVETMAKNVKQVKDNLSISQVATISAGDKATGALIAKAFEQVGLDGVISIDEGNAMVDCLNVVEGTRINRGYISPYMCADQNKMVAELDNPYILITDKKISHINEILPIVEQVAKVNGCLLIVAEDIDGDALTTLVVNNARKVFNCLGVRTPYFADRRKKSLSDLALITGGKFISQDIYNNFESVMLSDLGRCEKVKADKDQTVIIGAKGDKQKIAELVAKLREQLLTTTDDFDREVILGRISSLNGGVARIKVGAATEVEMREKKLRIEDALNATQAAIAEGIVVGGGVALLRAKKDLKTYIQTLTDDEKLGAMIVDAALEAPIRQIAKNAGVDAGVVVQEVLKNDNINFGYDALNDCYCDMFEQGIIDPFKVTRTALQCASSVASTLLTTECVVVADRAKLQQEKLTIN